MSYESVYIDGNHHHCGLLPTPEATKALFAVYGTPETIPAMTREELIASACDQASVRNPIFKTNQDGERACVGHGGVGAFMEAREAEGLPFVEMSCGCLYGQINGGRDQGANIGDALTALMKVGTVPASMIPQLTWQTSKFPTGWKTTAAGYRVVEAYLATSVLGFLSGIQRGYEGVFGVNADNAYKPGSDGWIPSKPSRSANHCQHALSRSSVYHPTRKLLGIKDVNSWDPWGLQNCGWAWLPETNIVLDEMFLIRVVTHPSA